MSEDTALFYALVSFQLGRIDSARPKTLTLNSAPWDYVYHVLREERLSANELELLADCMEKKTSYITDKVSFTCEACSEKVYVPIIHIHNPYLQGRTHWDDLCSHFHRELSRVIDEYKKLRALDVSLGPNLLQLIGDNVATRTFVLEMLARAQEIPYSDVDACWKIFIEYGLTSSGENPNRIRQFALELQSSIDYFTRAPDVACEFSNMLAQELHWERLGEILTLSWISLARGRCCAQLFADELYKLLARYDRDIEES